MRQREEEVVIKVQPSVKWLTSQVSDPALKVEGSWSADGAHWEYTVSDNGQEDIITVLSLLQIKVLMCKVLEGKSVWGNDRPGLKK